MKEKTKADRRRLVREFVEYLELVDGEVHGAKPAVRLGTDELCGFIQRATADCGTPFDAPEIDEDALLEAHRAYKARRIAGGGGTGAEGVHAGRTDGDAAKAVVQANLCQLRGAFALEFSQLVLDCFQPDFGGGEVGVGIVFFNNQRFNLAAAKERANALDWLAARIEELEKPDCNVDDVHEAIIAFHRLRHNA